MLVRAPLVKAEQDGSIRIQDLTKVVMARRRLGLAKERLVPFEATRDVAYANDRPCAFHRISAVGLTCQMSRAPQVCVFRPSRPACLCPPPSTPAVAAAIPHITARVDAEDVAAVDLLERRGFRLMDALVTYRIRPENKPAD